MLTQDGWFDWAERDHGPAYKVTGQVNSLSCVFLHSAVGSQEGVVNVVMGSTKASVTGSVAFDGSLIQFYPVTSSPWANGSPDWNNAGIGIEFEGGYNSGGHWETEPIYDAQVEAAAHILKDLGAYKQVDPEYWQRPSTLKEHREVYATACPSDRIRWDDILALVQPQRAPRNFLWGNELSGVEKRGKQQFWWNEGVETDALGDFEGLFPGQRWHNAGGLWVQVMP
jgi:hypothetical protein